VDQSWLDRHSSFVDLRIAASFVLCVLAAPTVSAAPAAIVLHSDVATGIESDAEMFVSMRYMRHLWVAPDGVQAAVVQQGGTTGLGLYSSFDDGASWTWEQDLPGQADFVSDGIQLDDGSLLLVTSLATNNSTADVRFIRLDYDPGVQGWITDPLTPSMVYDSNAVTRASRATIAMDGNGVLWSAFRLQNTTSGNTRIRLFFSVDDGITWQDSLNVLGTANAWAEKDAKVFSTGSGIGLVMQDVQGPAASPVRSKRWSHRDDADPLTRSIGSQLIAQMSGVTGDPYGSHWSVATDSDGDVHMSYQDDTIRYVRRDAATQTWSSPLSLGAAIASYNSLTLAADDDIYVFTRFNGGDHMWVKRWRTSTGLWSSWLQVSANLHDGLLRMCSPEHVDDRLPLLYQVNAAPPFELLHAFLDVD
jgi:hypothetical protein